MPLWLCNGYIAPKFHMTVTVYRVEGPRPMDNGSSMIGNEAIYAVVGVHDYLRLLADGDRGAHC